MTDDINAAERAMAERMRRHLGSAEQQHQRIEALIDALDPRHAKGIDRTSASWWKTPTAPN